jgi:transposase-like protein
MLGEPEEFLAFTAFPRRAGRRSGANNPQQPLNLKIRRRSEVVGLFPNRATLIRLVGAVLA